MNQKERDRVTRELELILQEKNTQNRALEKLIRELKKVPPQDHPRK